MLNAKEAHARTMDNCITHLMVYVEHEVNNAIEKGNFSAYIDCDRYECDSVVEEAIKEVRELGYGVEESLGSGMDFEIQW